MSKRKIDEKEFIRLMNEKMKEHPMYKNGMKIEKVPQNSDYPSGYSVHGNAEAVSSWAKAEIEKKYTLNF
jgi:hypothetical protein